MDRRFKYHASTWALPVIGVGLLVYFIYHIIQGKHGWLSWRTLEQKIEQSNKELESLKEEHERLKNKVTLLRPESLDEDMLDERVRTMLGTAKESEIVVIDEEESPILEER
jgi:cell division protein FtsB